MSGSRKSWFKRTKRRTLTILAGLLGPSVFRLVGRTWRFRLVGEPDEADTAGLVFAIWHENIPAGVYLHRDKGHLVMVSTHNDGEVITRIIERLGYRTVRGSSSRGGASALRTMMHHAENPVGMVFTPDGPRGPAHTVSPGAAYLAAATERPLRAVSFAANRCWRAGSWDRMIIPKPFAKIAVMFSEPFRISRSIAYDHDARAEACATIARRIDENDAQAREELQRWLAT